MASKTYEDPYCSTIRIFRMLRVNNANVLDDR